MGTNGVTMTDAQLKARALEIQRQFTDLGMTLPENFRDKKTGALFTYKKGEDGKITCTYDYHDEKTKDLIFFERKTVPTARAGLGYLTDEQFEEFKQNNPHHFYQSEYAAGDTAIFLKNHAQDYINSYDKATRNQARDDYQDIVTEELLASGTFDKKAAKKMGKYAKNDAIAEERSGFRTVYLDEAEFKIAEKKLKAEQKIAEKRIKAFYKSKKPYESLTAQERIQLELDMAKMEESVEYIKDKNVRAYINAPANKERFFVVNPDTGRFEFSSDLYKEWAQSHTQGDNTLTTSEREHAAVATGLSKRQMKKAVEYAGLDTQKDYTISIELAKTLVGLLSGPILAYMTNANIHDVKELKDRIEIVADAADPGKYQIFVDGVSIAEARSEVIANFRNVAVRNAALSSALALIFNNGLVDPQGARDRKANGITAATISTQNIFRGKEVVDLEGEVVIDDGGHEVPDESEACYEIDGTPPTPPTPGTEDENVVYLRMNDRCNVIFWYQTADAYPLPEGFKKSDIYNKIREANGDPNHDKYPPNLVGLPEYITLTDRNGNEVKVKRKDEFEIKGQCYEAPADAKKRATGKTYVGFKGTPGTDGKPGNYKVYDCKTGHVYVDGLPNREAAEQWIQDHMAKDE